MKKVLFVLLISGILLAMSNCDNDDLNEENSVTVTFETFGGTNIPSRQVRIGTTVDNVLPKNDPVKADHEFEGWFASENFVIDSRAINQKITRDITLYAKFVWYYPFEVSNISHTHEYVERNELGHFYR